VRDYDSIDSEQLWLAGLVQFQALAAGKQFVQIAGPLINTVVRHILECKDPGSVATPNFICFERDAISTAAYRRITQIENLLRNLIVADWYADVGDRWYEKLGGTKTSSRDTEEEEHLVRFVMEHVRYELVAMGIAAESNKTEPAPPLESPNRRPPRVCSRLGAKLAETST
jgi:hypothetical protein